MTAIVSIHELRKRYHPPDGPLALDGIDLQIHEGEIFSLLGPNGAGKTTLLAILSGLLRPTGGKAVVAGHDVARDPMAVKRVIGVVPEEIALYPQLSARQNLRYFGHLYGLGGQALDDAIDEVLDAIGLADRAREKVARYSNGMKRRLNVGVGLLHNPRIVFMDEPTVGLDPESRRRILDLVVRLNRERGTTILYTTHYMEEAQEISHRVGIIHRGRIIALGTPEELIQRLHARETLRLQIGTATLPPDALAAFQRIEGVEQISLGEGAVTFSVRGAAELVPAILRTAGEAGIEVRALTIRQPNLESVFLHLTGQQLTEGPL